MQLSIGIPPEYKKQVNTKLRTPDVRVAKSYSGPWKAEFSSY